MEESARSISTARASPVREWRPKKGVRHEALDARVYAYAALRALVSMGLVLDAEADRASAQGRPVREEMPTGARVNRSRWMMDR